MGKRDAREGSQVCLKERTAVRPLLLFLVDPQQISRAEVESSQSSPSRTRRPKLRLLPSVVLKNSNAPALASMIWRLSLSAREFLYFSAREEAMSGNHISTRSLLVGEHRVGGEKPVSRR